ncbi:MAG TPA: glycerol-3-phosphate 1-O-acyltransferase PlsY [Candidatus Onthomonas avicola]|nr:glycerol-3-phosphate 1-O-acyltransferase PlsY [Candidatus Onthomonas avicola]
MLGITALAIVAVALVSYFLGCCNSSIIVSKYLLGDDVRNHGSGNAGLTNFYRVYGKKNVVLVILIDVLKGLISCLIGGAILGSLAGWPVLGRYIAGLFCLLGHVFPCMFGFRGGKGILSGGAIVLMLDWRIALVVWGLFLILVAVSRMVSLGSMAAAIAFPIMTWVIYRSWILLAISVCISILILWRHKDNAKRIAHGEENKLEFHE